MSQTEDQTEATNLKGLKKIIMAISPTPGIYPKARTNRDGDNDTRLSLGNESFTFSVVTNKTKPLLKALFNDDVYTDLGKDDVMKDYKNYTATNPIGLFYSKNMKDVKQDHVVQTLQHMLYKRFLDDQKGQTPNPTPEITPVAPVVSAPLAPTQAQIITKPLGTYPSVILERTTTSWLKTRYATMMKAWYDAPLDESLFRNIVAQREQMWHTRKMLVPLAKGRCRVTLEIIESTKLMIHASSTDKQSPYAICALLHDECQPLFVIIETVFKHPLNMWDRHALRNKVFDAVDKETSPTSLKISYTLSQPFTNDNIDTTLETLQKDWPYDVSNASVSSGGVVTVDLTVNKWDAERGFEYFGIRGRAAPFTLSDALRTTGDHAPVCVLPVKISEDMHDILSKLLVELVDIRVKCALLTEYHSTAILDATLSSLKEMNHPLICGLRVLLKGLANLIEVGGALDKIELIACATMLTLDVDVSFSTTGAQDAGALAGVFRSMLHDDKLHQDFHMSCMSKDLFEKSTWSAPVKNQAMADLCKLHGDSMRDGSRLFLTEELAFRWRVFQARRLDITRALALQSVHGLRAFTSWTNIDGELRFDELIDLCDLYKETGNVTVATIAWLTTIAWQMHKGSPISHGGDDVWQRVDAVEQELRDGRDVYSAHRAYGLLTTDAINKPLSDMDVDDLNSHIVQLVYMALSNTKPALLHKLRREQLSPCDATSGHWYVTACMDLVRRVTTANPHTKSGSDLTRKVSAILADIGNALVANRSYAELVALFHVDDSTLTRIAAPRAASLVLYASGRDQSARIAYLDDHFVKMYDSDTVITSEPLQRDVLAAHTLSIDVHGQPIDPTSGLVAFDVINFSKVEAHSKNELLNQLAPHMLMIRDTFFTFDIDGHVYIVVKRCDLDRLGVEYLGATACIDRSSPLLNTSHHGVHAIPSCHSMLVEPKVNVQHTTREEKSIENEEELILSGLKMSTSPDFDSDYEAYTASLHTLMKTDASFDETAETSEATELLWWITMHATRQLPPTAYADGLPTPLGTPERPLYLPQDGTLAEWYEWTRSSEGATGDTTSDLTDASSKPTLHTGGLPIASIDLKLHDDICKAAKAYANGDNVKPLVHTLLKQTLGGERVSLPWINRTLAAENVDVNGDIGEFLRLFGRHDDTIVDIARSNRLAFLIYSQRANIPLVKKTVGSAMDDLMYEMHRRNQDVLPRNEDIIARQMRTLQPTFAYSPKIMDGITNGTDHIMTIDLFRPHALAVLSQQEQLFGSNPRVHPLAVELLTRVGTCAPQFANRLDAFRDVLIALDIPGYPHDQKATSCVMLDYDYDFLGLCTNDAVFCDVNMDRLIRSFDYAEPVDDPSNERKMMSIDGFLRRSEPMVDKSKVIVDVEKYFVGNGEALLDTYDGFLSEAITNVVKNRTYTLGTEDHYTIDPSMYLVTDTNTYNYKTWYRKLCERYWSDPRKITVELLDIQTDNNVHQAGLHEQAVRHTAAWLLSQSGLENRNKNKYNAIMEDFMDWKFLTDTDTTDDDEDVATVNNMTFTPPFTCVSACSTVKGFRPLFPMEFLPVLDNTLEEVESRLAITFRFMMDITKETYVQRSSGLTTVQSLVHIENSFSNGTRVPAELRCVNNIKPRSILSTSRSNGMHGERIRISTFDSTSTPSTKLSVFKNLLDVACTLRMQSSSKIKYTINESTTLHSPSDIYKTLFTNNTIEALGTSMLAALYRENNGSWKPSETKSITLRRPEWWTKVSTMRYPMYCRYVENTKRISTAIDYPKTVNLQPSSWDVAQPDMTRNTKPSTTDVKYDPRSVTNNQSDKPALSIGDHDHHGDRDLYVDRVQPYEKQLVRGDHRGEAWMKADQTTPEALRNLAQAIRKHMTYERVAYFTPHSTDNPKTTTDNEGDEDAQLLKDIQKRLNAEIEDSGATLVPPTRVSMNVTDLDFCYQIVNNLLMKLATQTSEYAGLDLHHKECFVLVQVVIAMLVGYVSGRNEQNLRDNIEHTLVLSALRLLPFIWMYIIPKFSPYETDKYEFIIDEYKVLRIVSNGLALAAQSDRNSRAERYSALSSIFNAGFGFLSNNPMSFGTLFSVGTGIVRWSLSYHLIMDGMLEYAALLIPYLFYAWLSMPRDEKPMPTFCFVVNGVVVHFVLYWKNGPSPVELSLPMTVNRTAAKNTQALQDNVTNAYKTALSNHTGACVSTLTYAAPFLASLTPRIDYVAQQAGFQDGLEKVAYAGAIFKDSVLKLFAYDGKSVKCTNGVNGKQIVKLINDLRDITEIREFLEGDKNELVLVEETDNLYHKVNRLIIAPKGVKDLLQYHVSDPATHQDSGNFLYKVYLGKKGKNVITLQRDSINKYQDTNSSLPPKTIDASQILLEYKNVVDEVIIQKFNGTLTTLDSYLEEYADTSIGLSENIVRPGVVFGFIPLTLGLSMADLYMQTSIVVEPLMSFVFQLFWTAILYPMIKAVVDSDIVQNLLINLYNGVPTNDILNGVNHTGLILSSWLVTFLDNRLYKQFRGKSLNYINETADDKQRRMVALCGWYTTAQLKLLGDLRVDRHYRDEPDRDRVSINRYRQIVKLDLQAVTAYQHETGFRWLYTTNEQHDSKTNTKQPSTSNQPFKANDRRYLNTLIQLLKNKDGLQVVTQHTLRDLAKVLVMARDGNFAYRTRLRVSPTASHTFNRIKNPALLNALKTLAPSYPTNYNDRRGHVVWNEDESVTISDALKAALSNLLALDGNAAKEYNMAKTLQPTTQFNKFMPFDVGVTEQRVISGFTATYGHFANDNIKNSTQIKQIMYALCHYHLKDVSTDMMKNLTNEDAQAFIDSIRRQAFSLLGRFVYTTSSDNIQIDTSKMILLSYKIDNEPLDFTVEIIRNMYRAIQSKTKSGKMFFLNGEDFLLGSFAYPSSFFEQQL